MDTEGYIVLRNVLCTQTLDLLKIQTKMVENIECFKINEKPQSYPFGDNQCKNSFAKYGILCYESLLLLLKPLMEKHRVSCEYSATICITIDNEPWDIYFKKYDSTEVCVSLNPGDLIIYKGTELEHWREKYNCKEQIQVFLHYIDKNGPYNTANYINDGRPIIGIEKRKIL